MKTRDVIKNALAGFVAAATVVGIVGMRYAEHQRRIRSEEEARRISESLRQRGVGEVLPQKASSAPPPTSQNPAP